MKAYSSNIWHQRFGNVSDELLSGSLPHLNGVQTEKLFKNDNCNACAVGKPVRAPRESLSFMMKLGTKPLNGVYKDMVGPIECQSVDKSRYFTAVLDSCSDDSMVRFMYRLS